MLRISLIFVATFFSVSSGAYLVAIYQVLMIGWERLTRGIGRRWLLLGAGIAFLYIFVDLVSNRTPVHVFVSHMTLNPGTAYGRMLIWELGFAEVLRNPIFGTGVGDWDMPAWQTGSVDNFWLVEAMRHGVPAVLFLLGAIIWLGFRLSQKTFRDPRLRNCRLAWMTTMFGLVVAGGTVHFWGAIFSLFFFLLGSGVWMFQVSEAGHAVRFLGPRVGTRPTSRNGLPRRFANLEECARRNFGD